MHKIYPGRGLYFIYVFETVAIFLCLVVYILGEDYFLEGVNSRIFTVMTDPAEPVIFR